MSHIQQATQQNTKLETLQIPKNDMADSRSARGSWSHIEIVSDETSLNALKLINSGLEFEYKRLSGSDKENLDAMRRKRTSVVRGVITGLHDTVASASVVACGLDYLGYMLTSGAGDQLEIKDFAGQLQRVLDSQWMLLRDRDRLDLGASSSVAMCVQLSLWQAQFARFESDARPTRDQVRQLSSLLAPQNDPEVSPVVAMFQDRLKDSICLLSQEVRQGLVRQVSRLRIEFPETRHLDEFLANKPDIALRCERMSARVSSDLRDILVVPEPLREAVSEYRNDQLQSLSDEEIKRLTTIEDRAKVLRKEFPKLCYASAAIALCAEAVWRGMRELIEAQVNQIASITSLPGVKEDVIAQSERLSELLGVPHMLPLLATTTKGIEPHITVHISLEAV